jgi:hypothetical protein
LHAIQLLLTGYSADIQSACAQNSTELAFAERLFDDQSTSGELPFWVRLERNSKEPFSLRLLCGVSENTEKNKAYGSNTY